MAASAPRLNEVSDCPSLSCGVLRLFFGGGVAALCASDLVGAEGIFLTDLGIRYARLAHVDA